MDKTISMSQEEFEAGRAQFLEEAMQRFETDPLSSLVCIPQHERIWFLLDNEHLISREAFWECFRMAWEQSENLYQLEEAIQELLTPEVATDQQRFSVMTEGELDVYNKLPESVRVYRGCWAGNQNGWSYTIDREKAVWFANRLPMDGQPLLIEGLIKKEDVILYSEARQESEVIVDPDNVKEKTIHRLPPVEPDKSQLLSHLIQSGQVNI